MATQAHSSRDIPKAYDPHSVERSLYEMWEAGGYFTPAIEPAQQPFCVIMPPPNVTGELHLGHALTATIEDILTRWHRMRGEPTLWLPGVDHAGIATQVVVEQELAREGLIRHGLGREKFLERVWLWVARHRRLITQQHKRLGASCDWTRERFTMDEGPQQAVRTTFVNLYHDGLIYRGERIINWCPRCQTALSDLEVDHQEVRGHLWYVRYPLAEEEGRGKGEGEPPPSSSYITIATTRPETIVADVAIAVNPEDERYRGLIGRQAILPALGRRLPIVADGVVDAQFGTGALKITPGHDPVDFEVGQRHGLPTIIAIAPDGTMNQEAGPYQGLERFRCREAIVRDLEAQGLLAKVEGHSHAVGHCQRCRTMVEPVVSQQWFVRAGPLAEAALAAVADGRIRILPHRFQRTYEHWLENIRDWCISRQLWWGHRIPVWYCQGCGAQAAPAAEAPMIDPDRCAQCGSARLEQDPDVLDTWFSSALWTHSTLGWPEATDDLRYFYPTSVMETGYDILFFWVARMVMMGLYNMKGQAPFRVVYLHGLIRDERGEKMSKTRGNVVDPLAMVDTYGADALRFSLATGSTPGNDMRLTPQRLEAGRNFANKLWNAARFVITSLGDGAPDTPDASQRQGLPLEDRWILSRTHRLITDVQRLLSEFQLGEAGRQVYDFVWGEYCDWYIEMSKVRLRAGDPTPLAVLAHVLDQSLRLLHPFMPFVTEAIWQNLKGHLRHPGAEVLIVAPWPLADPAWRDDDGEGQMAAVIEAIKAIRNVRAERQVPAGQWVEAYIVPNPEQGAQAAFEDVAPAIRALARCQPLHIVGNGSLAPSQDVVTVVLEAGRVVLPLAGLVDLEGERARLRRQMEEAEAERERLNLKLADEQFRAKAPAAIVAKEEERLHAADGRLAALRQRLAELGGL